MKYLQGKFYVLSFLTIISGGLTISCKSSPKHAVSSMHVKDADGISISHPILLHGLSREFQWILLKYPSATIVSQSLEKQHGKYFKIITFDTGTGEVKNLYFQYR